VREEEEEEEEERNMCSIIQPSPVVMCEEISLPLLEFSPCTNAPSHGGSLGSRRQLGRRLLKRQHRR
jgi:hypothetical protein